MVRNNRQNGVVYHNPDDLAGLNDIPASYLPGSRMVSLVFCPINESSWIITGGVIGRDENKYLALISASSRSVELDYRLTSLPNRVGFWFSKGPAFVVEGCF